jgi:mRNA interferase MazF
MVEYIPKKGDIVWVEFCPQKGKEIAKTRPAVVISNNNYNAKTGLALFVPITSSIKGYPFEIIVECEAIKKGAILCDQVRCMDWKMRKVRKISSLKLHALEAILHNIKLLLSE